MFLFPFLDFLYFFLRGNQIGLYLVHLLSLLVKILSLGLGILSDQQFAVLLANLLFILLSCSELIVYQRELAL